MATAKVEIKIGSLFFSGEGTEDWIEKQLDKLMQHAPSLLSDGVNSPSTEETNREPNNDNTGTLASFLKASGANGDQDKFLATAEWLHAKGTKRLTTSSVTKAMDDNNQGRVTNPTMVMKRLVKKGHIERSGTEFYVSGEGRLYLRQ